MSVLGCENNVKGANTTKRESYSIIIYYGLVEAIPRARLTTRCSAGTAGKPYTSAKEQLLETE